MKLSIKNKETIMKFVLNEIVERVEDSTMGTIKNNVGELRKGETEMNWKQHNLYMERVKKIAMINFEEIVKNIK